jgi:hypothetical protein
MLLTLGATLGYAAHDTFNDVAANDVHAPGIHFLSETGITAGCAAGRFCPSDSLTRGQMGTFIRRLAGDDPNVAPSVNAAELDGHAAEEFLRERQQIEVQNAVQNSTANSVTVNCPAGQRVLGGGGFTSSGEWRLEDSRPNDAGTAWQVFYRKDTAGAGNQTTRAFAICATTG